MSCLITIIGFIALIAINTKVIKAEVSKTLLEKNMMEVRQIARQAEILYEHDAETSELQSFVEKLKEDNDYIAYAVVVDDKVTALAHSDQEKIGKSYSDDNYTVEAATQGKMKHMVFYADVQKKWVYDIMVPINLEGKQVGAMDVGIYQNQILGLVGRLTRFQIIGIMGLEVVFAVLLYIICHYLLKHLQNIVQALDAMAQGNFTVKVEGSLLKKNDEIGIMGKALNNMRQSLAKLISEIADEANKMRSISEKLTENAEETKNAANHITGSIENVVSGNKNQTKLSKQTAVMSEEIQQGMDRITENVQAVTSFSNNMVGSAESGNKLVQVAVDQMQRINDQVTESFNEIQALEVKSKEIENIIGMITQIAKQTNLLALNASIEAARAGDQGKGFAVVADEVRVLAEQSTHAADEIAAIISVIRGDIEHSVSSMNTGIDTVKEGLEIVTKTGDTFKNILQEINEVSGEMESVSAITEEVNAGTHNVLSNIDKVAEIVENTSMATEDILNAAQNQEQLMNQVAESTEELNQLSESLNEQVQVFKI